MIICNRNRRNLNSCYFYSNSKLSYELSKLYCVVDFVLKSCARGIDVNLNIPLSVNMLCVRDRRVRIRFLQVIR